MLIQLKLLLCIVIQLLSSSSLQPLELQQTNISFSVGMNFQTIFQIILLLNYSKFEKKSSFIISKSWLVKIKLILVIDVFIDCLQIIPFFQMNITQTFRRKNHYCKPIIVFSELYRDYYKQASPFKYHNPNLATSATNLKPRAVTSTDQFHNQEPQEVPILRKTRSAEKFSQYLLKHRNPSSMIQTQTNLRSKTMNKISRMKRQTFFIRQFEEAKNQQNEETRRAYFKDNYTQSHPFFEKTQAFMKGIQIEKNQIQKSSPILPDVFKQSDETLRKPMQKRMELLELKNKFMERKQKAVEQFSKVRYNFLVKKNYREEQQQDRSFSNKIQGLHSSFQLTKSHIFPQSVV